ncbi:MAG: hypothetical protein EP344_01780 [Bacteroidetes bacterium]|nr:MAG: hypothetical protein EP344_01780 [Bacteroidota bacterium]
MEHQQALHAVKQLISQGELEAAYEQLVQVLDSSADYAGLADIARINQADLYQLKAQTLKGTISAEDARLTTNQLADKALQLVRQLETGKTDLDDTAHPTRSGAWRYYVIGGLVTLAVVAILYFWLRQDEQENGCPAFSRTAELKVMILPFKQPGSRYQNDPAIDIMEGMNKLIDATPGLRVRAIADVNEHYDINKDYPNSAQAVEIARGCNAQMLVWGRVKKFERNNYTLDVRYRLLDAGGVRYAGDTTVSRLLTVTEEASWTHNVQAISQLLYMVLANQMQVPIAANILKNLQPPAGSPADSLPPVDTSTSFVLADYYIMKKQDSLALAEYGKVLEHYPENATALTKRGALLLDNKDYTAAARDLEAVKSGEGPTAELVQKARIKAFLESGQPEKARIEVEEARKTKTLDGAWLDQKSREVRDSTVALQDRRDEMERKAAAVPDLDARIGAAKANLGLGETESALKYTRDALRQDPKNLEAVRIAVEAQLRKGDTAQAAQTIRSAERAGADVKEIKLQPVIKKVLTDRRGQ